MNKPAMHDTSNHTSLRKGLWFFFTVNGHQVTHHSSLLSGRERIWVDDELVVNRTGWGIFNAHKIWVDDQSFELKTGFKSVNSIFVSRIDCELYQDGALLEAKHNQLTSTSKLLMQFFYGACAGMAIGFFLRSVLGG